VSDSQFNAIQTGIALGTSVPNLTLSDNLFIVPAAGNGIAITGAGLYAIGSNAFQGITLSGNAGIVISGASSAGGVIAGNCFFKLLYGISLGASSVGVNVQSNSYTTVTTSVQNLGGAGNTIGGGSS
jgi:hypothetical protein